MRHCALHTRLQEVAQQALHHRAGLGGAFNELFDSHRGDTLPGQRCVAVDPACTGGARKDGVAHCNPDCNLRNASGIRKGCSHGSSCGCPSDENAFGHVHCGCVYTTHCNLDGVCTQHNSSDRHCSCAALTVAELKRISGTVLANRQRVIDAYQLARDPNAKLLSCAACGLRESTTDNAFSRIPISELGVFKYMHPDVVASAHRSLVVARLAEKVARDNCKAVPINQVYSTVLR